MLLAVTLMFQHLTHLYSTVLIICFRVNVLTLVYTLAWGLACYSHI